MLNAYVCPYKTKPREIVKGTLFTVAAWAAALAGFAVYLKFGNTGRLYGAISAAFAVAVRFNGLFCGGRGVQQRGKIVLGGNYRGKNAVKNAPDETPRGEEK